MVQKSKQNYDLMTTLFDYSNFIINIFCLSKKKPRRKKRYGRKH